MRLNFQERSELKVVSRIIPGAKRSGIGDSTFRNTYPEGRYGWKIVRRINSGQGKRVKGSLKKRKRYGLKQDRKKLMINHFEGERE